MIRDKTAIAGIGTTEYTKNIGRSELETALEAIRAALDDAGPTPAGGRLERLDRYSVSRRCRGGVSGSCQWM